MIRRRHFTPAMRRRLAEVDAKPGLSPDIIDAQAGAAERRMPIIDAQPEAWRGLLNDYPHQIVAAVAESCSDPDRARRILEARFGRGVS